MLDEGALGGLRRYAVNSTWLLAEQILRMVAGLLVGTWVARHLGPADYGLLSYCLSYVALYAAIARLGMDALTVRMLVTDPSQGAILLGTVFRIKLFGSVAAVVLVAMSATFVANSPVEAIYITVIASGLLFQSFDVIDFWFQAKTETRVPSLCRLAQLAVSSCIKITLVLLGAGLGAFVVVAVIDQMLLAGFFWIAFRRRHYPNFVGTFDRTLARSVLHKAKPLIVAGILVSLYSRLDQVILRHIAGAEWVGWYAAAVVVAEALYALPIAVATALFPAIVTSHQGARERYDYHVMLLTRTLVLGGVVVSVVMSVAAEAVVGLLYGASYGPSAQVLRIIVWILPLICYSAVLGKALITEGRQRILPRLTGIALVTHVLCLFALVPTFGLKGAAVSAVLAQSAPVVVLLLADRATRRSFFAMLFGPESTRKGGST